MLVTVRWPRVVFEYAVFGGVTVPVQCDEPSRWETLSLMNHFIVSCMLTCTALVPVLATAQSADQRRGSAVPQIEIRKHEPIVRETPSDGGLSEGSDRYHGGYPHGPRGSVTNNYYGYGWPIPRLYGPNVYNYVNGVPVHFGGYYRPYPFVVGYPYVYPYGYSQYGFSGSATQFNQPIPWNQGNLVGNGFVAGVVEPRVVQPIANAAAIDLPKARDVMPGNEGAAEIQRRVDVLRASTPTGRERADRSIAQGDELFAKQRFISAAAKYRDAMSKAADYPKPHFRLAHCYVASGSFDLALTRFLMALELAGSADRTNFSLEELYRGNKLAKQSHLDRLQDAILREPDDGGLVFLFALTLHYDQHPLEARQQFLKAKEMAGAHQAYVHLFLPIVTVAEPTP